MLSMAPENRSTANTAMHSPLSMRGYGRVILAHSLLSSGSRPAQWAGRQLGQRLGRTGASGALQRILSAALSLERAAEMLILTARSVIAKRSAICSLLHP